MNLTPGWESSTQRPSRCDLRTNGINKKSPGQLVLLRDMILPNTFFENWRLIRKRKQAQIDKDVLCENYTRVDHDYRIGD